MTDPTIPVLPENAELQYLGEGAANIVYRISIPPPQPSTPPPAQLEEYGEGTPPPSEIGFDDGDEGDSSVFENKLLRLRKDLPTTFPCQTAQSSWTRLIAPLFPASQLVTQSLVSLRPNEYNHIDALNSSLKAWEKEKTPSSTSVEDEEPSSRPPKRHGGYLANDEYGLLVTDMTGPGVLQFKPKWLTQSPSAPSDARRCRQCALVARKAFLAQSNPARVKKVKTKGDNTPSFCPLYLLSKDKDVVRKVAEAILGPEAGREDGIVERFTKWITETSLLTRLRDVQFAMDRHGVLAAETASEELRVAMTVRDCSVFVRVSGSSVDEGEGKEEGEVEARIGDLDVKSPDKLAYWKETERVLIEEGWYAGREEGRGNACSLGRV